MTKRRFELEEGASKKFWEIEEGAEGSFTVCYGRIGTAGQSQTKTFGSGDEARKAATKLIAEKTRKGYAEVGAAAAPAPPTARVESIPASSAGALPAFSGPPKAWTAEQLTALAAQLAPITTWADWQKVRASIAATDQEAGPVIAHLLAYGALKITHAAQLSGCEQAFYAAAERPEVALRILASLDEDIVVAPHHWPTFFAVFARILVRAPEQLSAAVLPRSLARQALLARMLAFETLPREQALEGLIALGDALPNGRLSRIYVAIDRRIQPVTPAHLLEALARNLGPRWIRDFAKSSELPAEVATPALEGEPLEEVARALSSFNREILAARADSAARFFEVADALTSEADANKALKLRLAGMERARTPDDIPAHLEDTIAPAAIRLPFGVHQGFGKLGPDRLDRWARAWLERHPPALAVHDPRTDAEMEAVRVRGDLRHALFGGIPFGPEVSRAIIGAPHAHPARAGHPTTYRAREFLEEVRFSSAGALRALPVIAELIEASEIDPALASAYRMLAVLALDAALKDEVPDARFDALVVLGDAKEHDHKKVMRRVVARLSVARREAVIRRGRASLAEPASELEYAGAGASSDPMARFAQLLVAGRADDATWSRERTQNLKALGPELGRHIIAALAGERASKSFLHELRAALDPEAFAFVQANAGKPLDLGAELAQLARELGGSTVPVYLLDVDDAEPGAKLTRAGGVPAGFTAADVPRRAGRELLHAFTVDLLDVPELGARFPGARTLSFWIDPQGAASSVAQALIPQTDAAVSAHPASEASRTLTLTRVMVPEAAFAADPTGRAGYARTLVYRSPGFLLGGPLWLQDGAAGLDPEFMGQYDTRVAEGANFGDTGICYSFRTRAEWQCY